MSDRHQDAVEHLHSGRRPAEYYIDEKWDKCIDVTLRRVTYSTLAAGAVAIVLLSKFAYGSLYCIRYHSDVETGHLCQ